MAKFFINRPIVAMVISIIFVVAGLVVLLKLPIAMYPEITTLLRRPPLPVRTTVNWPA